MKEIPGVPGSDFINTWPSYVYACHKEMFPMKAFIAGYKCENCYITLQGQSHTDLQQIVILTL